MLHQLLDGGLIDQIAAHHQGLTGGEAQIPVEAHGGGLQGLREALAVGERYAIGAAPLPTARVVAFDPHQITPEALLAQRGFRARKPTGR